MGSEKHDIKKLCKRIETRLAELSPDAPEVFEDLKSVKDRLKEVMASLPDLRDDLFRTEFKRGFVEFDFIPLLKMFPDFLDFPALDVPRPF